MTISQRGAWTASLCDVVCTGRFYDFLEKRAGRWGIVLRQPIYEKDRLDPVDPGAPLELDQALLARFPEGYRHLAYLQTQIGYTVKLDMPGLKGAGSRGALRARPRLAGGQAARQRHALTGEVSPARPYRPAKAGAKRAGEGMACETPTRKRSPKPCSTGSRTRSHLASRRVSEALVRHLHAFMREVEPTRRNGRPAIEFPHPRPGRLCNGTRQEFILLSDVVGASMLVDAINHRLPGARRRRPCSVPSTWTGAATEKPLEADISAAPEGDPLFVRELSSHGGRRAQSRMRSSTLALRCRGLLRRADARRARSASLNMRASFRTDAQGRFRFWSIVPSFYPIPHDGPVGQCWRAQGRHPYRPAHVHFMIAAPGSETLVTHVFIDGDKYLDCDAVFGVKDSLIRALEPIGPGKTPAGQAVDEPASLLTYHFVLSPEKPAAPRVLDAPDPPRRAMPRSRRHPQLPLGSGPRVTSARLLAPRVRPLAVPRVTSPTPSPADRPLPSLRPFAKESDRPITRR